MKTFIGIDGGMQGAIAVIDSDSYQVFDMPTYKIKKGKKSKTLYDKAQIESILLTHGKHNCLVILENAQAYPGQGAVSNFTTGRCFGFMEGILKGMGCPHEIITPKTWQKTFFTGKAGESKALAYSVACDLFPLVEFKTPRGRMLDGRSDAILICEHGRRIYGVN